MVFFCPGGILPRGNCPGGYWNVLFFCPGGILPGVYWNGGGCLGGILPGGYCPDT